MPKLAASIGDCLLEALDEPKTDRDRIRVLDVSLATGAFPALRKKTKAKKGTITRTTATNTRLVLFIMGFILRFMFAT